MTESIIIERNVPMEARDGTILRSDIYRPGDNEKYPAIVTRTPYNKLQVPNGHFMRINDTVLSGYALVFQDIRGRFSSEGKYNGGGMSMTEEGSDGYDFVEWTASQPWCDGNVGMAGLSYMGLLQWVTAEDDPPHLKAISPWIIGSSPVNELSLFDGVIGLGMIASWTAMMGFDAANRQQKNGKEVSRMRKMLSRAVADPDEVYNHLPLKDAPHFDFDGVRELWHARVSEAIPGSEFEKKAHWAYDKISVPCFQVSGWYELFARGTFLNFKSMREKGAAAAARKGQYLLVGPWCHGTPQSCAGGLFFGNSADPLGSKLTERLIDYFDRYLKGMDTALPAVRYFLMGENRWKEAEDWPLPQTQWKRYFLHSRGRANSSTGEGYLSMDEPGSGPPDMFIYNPHFPVPSTGGRGEYGRNGFVNGPVDQSRIEKRDDILCYTTDELVIDLEITGPLRLHLFASTSVKDTDFAAKLCDVHPDGRSFNVADGIIRARYRKSVFRPEFVTPGDIIEYEVDLGNSSQLFRKGHRIRIDISSSNFPTFDRNMNTGNAIGEDAVGIPAMQSVFHEPGYASYIDLPVIPD